MNLAERIDLMVKLGKYLTADSEELKEAKKRAYNKNKWFTKEFVNIALKNIATAFLDKQKLEEWIKIYHLDDNIFPKTIGIVMAGNIPLVGFHDFLCVFISGHYQKVKLSEKDDVLFSYILKKLTEWNSKVSNVVQVADILKDCDAYIATGSNNSARYFNYYFGKYPSIIRSNKTSVAILTGKESEEELSLLADDVQTFFGLGCRNITQIFVPEGYDFVPLLGSFKKYGYFAGHSKYKNNYDYHLALLIMNNKFYMTNESIVLVENENIFSGVSQLNYSFYKNAGEVIGQLKKNKNIQCLVGEGGIAFGSAQQPGLKDYADGIDTMQFLLSL
ncbi:MAG: acyl-CoA reductase [Bacteroidota bacterium]|nr:acyl-CoA reductase [Bacteroidota bacterium]